MKLFPLTVAAIFAAVSSIAAEENGAAIKTLIPWLLEDQSSFRKIRFADVIEATSGKKVLPIDRQDRDDQRVLAAIGSALDAVLAELNAPTSKTRSARRVNEMSSHFENAIQTRLSAIVGVTCAFPKTAAGKAQRSGYPDLVLKDNTTGRIYYLDPKLYAAGSATSSFRTFYFEPKRETNKVTEDARHLIIGIEHRRDEDGSVRFAKWQLVDLAEFRVRLKAEFEGSNADMYRTDAIVGSSASQ